MVLLAWSHAASAFRRVRFACAIAAAFLAVALTEVSAAAPPTVEIDAERPVQDVTKSVVPVFAPAEDANDQAGEPQLRTLAIDAPFDGWAMLSLKNAGTEKIERVLVFTYPTLPRSGIWGAEHSLPVLASVRARDGSAPQQMTVHGHNRFAALRIALRPGETQTYTLKFDHAGRAAGAMLWEVDALDRFDRLLEHAAGFFWGILFVGVALMFAMKVLSNGTALATGGILALTAIIFEGVSFGFGASSFGALLAHIGVDGMGIGRALSLVLLSFCGLEFLRRLLALQEAMPITDLVLRLVQYGFLVASVVVVFWSEMAPPAARISAGAALFASGWAVWRSRETLPDAFQLVPPGWFFLVAAAIGGLAVSTLGLAGGPLFELVLHGLFVIGIMLLIFSAAVRATVPAGFFEVHSAPTPAFQPSPPAVSAPAPSGESYQGLWDLNVATDQLYVSPSVEQILGVGEGALQGSEERWLRHILADDRAAYRDTLQEHLRTGERFVTEFRVRDQRSGTKWLQLRANVLAGSQRVVGVVTDITAAKAAEEDLLRDAAHDAATGLPSRHALVNALDSVLAGMPMRGKEARLPILVLLGVDGLARVNEEIGAGAGEEMMKALAERIEGILLPSDFLARAAEDVLAILVAPGEETQRNPNGLFGALSTLFDEPIMLAEHEVMPRAKLAQLHLKRSHHLGRDVLAEAETLLTRTPKTMREAAEPSPEATTAEAGLRRFQSEIRDHFGTAQGRGSLASDLRQALQLRQLKLAYEPIVSLADRTLAGFQASLLWQHPSRGVISPSELDAAVQAAELQDDVARFFLSGAVAQLADWQQRFPSRRPLFLLVKTSALTGEISGRLAEAMKGVRIANATLKIEMSESEALAAGAVFSHLKQTVACIALNEGTSLSAVARPGTMVKVSPALAAAAGSRGTGDVTLRSLIAAAHGSKSDVIAGAITTEAQVLALTRFACDYAQGAFFGGPMNAEDAARFITKHARIDGARPAMPEKV